jgi:putative sterol carrier protein
MAALVVAVPPAGAQDTKGIMAGACSVSITPTGTVWMAGGEHGQSKGVHDDIFCRALVLKSDSEMLAIASVDLMGFMNAYVQEVRKSLKSVPGDRLLLAATHDHSAPDVIGLWGPEGQSGVDKEYLASVKQKIADCVETAAKNLAPARIKFASGELKGIAKNWQEANSIDETLAVMQVEASDGSKTIATLVNYACHPEVMNVGMITADWPGYLYKRLEQKLGGVAIFVNGALGAMVSPAYDDAHKAGKDNWAIIETMGNAMADRAAELLQAATPITEAPIALKSSPVIAAMENQGFLKGIQAGVLPEIVSQGNVNTEVAVATIGPAQIVTIPGEAEPKINFTLKDMMNGQPKFVFGICQDELGYIMVPEDYGTEKYNYETSMSIGKSIAPAVVDALKALLLEVKPEVTSLKDWIASLPKTVKADKIGDLSAVYQFNASGEGGGNWILTVKDGALAVQEGKTEKPDCTIGCSAADWLAILNGKLDAVQAYYAGKLTVDNEDLAVRFGQLLLR